MHLENIILMAWINKKKWLGIMARVIFLIVVPGAALILLGELFYRLIEKDDKDNGD